MKKVPAAPVRISKLNEQIRSTLAEIVGREIEILIGGANGATAASSLS
jgi:hypothetical protein